jgi:hypothetical protein
MKIQQLETLIERNQPKPPLETNESFTQSQTLACTIKTETRDSRCSFRFPQVKAKFEKHDCIFWSFHKLLCAASKPALSFLQRRGHGVNLPPTSEPDELPSPAAFTKLYLKSNYNSDIHHCLNHTQVVTAAHDCELCKSSLTVACDDSTACGYWPK